LDGGSAFQFFELGDGLFASFDFHLGGVDLNLEEVVFSALQHALVVGGPENTLATRDGVSAKAHWKCEPQALVLC
jgi:hypothetical protein